MAGQEVAKLTSHSLMTRMKRSQEEILAAQGTLWEKGCKDGKSQRLRDLAERQSLLGMSGATRMKFHQHALNKDDANIQTKV